MHFIAAYILPLFLLHWFPLKFLLFYYRQAGKQIQGVIRSAYKIERQAAGMQHNNLKSISLSGSSNSVKRNLSPSLHFFLFFVPGLKDILGELPRREASRFRSQVCSLVKYFLFTIYSLEKKLFLDPVKLENRLVEIPLSWDSSSEITCYLHDSRCVDIRWLWHCMFFPFFLKVLTLESIWLLGFKPCFWGKARKEHIDKRGHKD